MPTTRNYHQPVTLVGGHRRVLWVPTFLIATPTIRLRRVIQLVKTEPLLGTQCRQFFSGTPSTTEFDSKSDTSSESKAHRLVNAMWTVQSRHYFHQEGASVTAASYCQQ